jgi:hypothetical protein
VTRAVRRGRRGFLATVGALAAEGLAAHAIAGCASAPTSAPAPPAPDAPPPIRIASLASLLPLAHLRWVVLAAPREIAAVPWLIPPIARIAPEENLARFAASVGFDLRQLPEAAVATYDAGEGAEVTIHVVRHNADPNAIERPFRARLVGGEHRSVDRADVVRVSGRVGTSEVTLLLAGRDVAAFQVGGSPARGPARIASLYALEKLKKSPTVLAADPLKTLDTRLGPAPFRAFAPGPFEGDLARGARGLLAGATAVGCAIRPSAREALLVSIAVSGDFTTSAPGASEELTRAWDDLARGSFGHLVGLDEPVEKPLATHAADAVAIAVQIDPNKLAVGLARATSAKLDEIMR